MALNNDCWALIVEFLDSENHEHLRSLRQMSSQLRSFCDRVFFRELVLDLDGQQIRTAHYLARLDDQRDPLRYHIRHLKITGRELGSTGWYVLVLAKALRNLELSGSSSVPLLQSIE